MAAPLRCFAIANFALIALTTTGCLIMRPCAPGNWHYHSCDGLCQEDGQSQAVRGCREPKLRTSASVMPRQRSTIFTQEATARQRHVQEPSPAVEACAWHEADSEPSPTTKGGDPYPAALAAKNPPSRAATATPVADSAHLPVSPADRASPVDHVPYNWGFFGASTRR